MSKRKKIKSRRKPKIVRDRGWQSRVLQGEIDDDLQVPQVERVLPRGQEEERVNLWTKIESELDLEVASQSEELVVPTGWLRGIVVRVSTGLYHVDLGDATIICGIRGSLSASETGYTNVVAVGDRVLISSEGLPDNLVERSSAVEQGGVPQGGVIERVLPRETVLARPDVMNPDVSQIIVSNVDQLLIVSSWIEPDIWLELIDRALITAAEGKMEPLICVNKMDLLDEDEIECREAMTIYQDLGYIVLFTSAVTGQGIDALRKHLTGCETALVGLSGTGKSSLLMAVQPDLALAVADVSDYSGQGRHTTTQVSLLKLDQGGYVVDTPGIRELGLVKVHRYELVLYFPEIEALVEGCRFNDCTHTHEPGCAVIEAVEQERIPWSRYASYQSIYESLPEYYTE